MKKQLIRWTALLLLAAMTLSLTGCGETKKAENAVKGMFLALKRFDFNAAQEFVNVGDLSLVGDTGDSSDVAGLSKQDVAVMKELFNRLDFRILSSEKIDSDTVTVLTDVTAVNMKPVVADFSIRLVGYALGSAFSSKKTSDKKTVQAISELLMESIQETETTTTTTKVSIKVVRNGDSWRVETGPTFLDALFGGGVTALAKLAT